ncbi:hypothetical protein BDA96_10G349800 [Sorghum bicolor]|uniref:Uncharacterized protein n=1 Tax=Sorghum bicolor TaxID=4558 RepID=A0A921U368_SORBI|nr:hypothetical protein BDA96_10G349800 [Sorghum bicolor]
MVAAYKRTPSNTAMIHLTHHGRGSRGHMRWRMCPHPPSRKGRRGGPRHRTSPQAAGIGNERGCRSRHA